VVSHHHQALLCIAFNIGAVPSRSYIGAVPFDSIDIISFRTALSWGRKAVCLLLQVARRVKKRNYLSLPREFDINPKSPLWKLFLLHHFALVVSMSGT
jgi:hypothetical protein